MSEQEERENLKSNGNISNNQTQKKKIQKPIHPDLPKGKPTNPWKLDDFEIGRPLGKV